MSLDGNKNFDDLLINQKYKNNKRHKIAYWKKVYKIDVKDDQYEVFSNNSNLIKKCLPILPFLRQLHLIDEEPHTTTYNNI